MHYLASDEVRLQHFCNLTGFGQKDMVEQLQDVSFQGFLLDYCLQNESELLAFCADAGIAPNDVTRARHKLPGFSE